MAFFELFRRRTAQSRKSRLTVPFRCRLIPVAGRDL